MLVNLRFTQAIHLFEIKTDLFITLEKIIQVTLHYKR